MTEFGDVDHALAALYEERGARARRRARGGRDARAARAASLPQLPRAHAKLEPEDPEHIEKGLVIKVGFGSSTKDLEWKEGLTELSGGQKSLIALSLVLSLLRFKPAPMYILDEVDAALDPRRHAEHRSARVGRLQPVTAAPALSRSRGALDASRAALAYASRPTHVRRARASRAALQAR